MLLKSLRGRSFLVSGAYGLIGSYLVCLLIEANRQLGLGICVKALDRNVGLPKRFPKNCEDSVKCHILDVCMDSLPVEKYDYVIHAASNT